MKQIRQSVLLFCVVYSLATLFSSILQVAQGQEFDTNFHIIIRGWIALIGVVTLHMIRCINFNNKVLNIALPYAISMIFVFLSVWISGFFIELHVNAYRDIFINYTAGYIVVISMLKLPFIAKRLS